MVVEISRAHTLLSIRNAEKRYVVAKTNGNAPLRDRALRWLHETMNADSVTLHTFLTAVNCFDRVLSRSGPLSEKNTSLLRTACMLVAGKHDEMEGPTVQDAHNRSNHSVKDILAAERQLCHILDMDLMFPSPVYFLDYFSSMLKEAARTTDTALKIIELFAFVDDSSSYTPSCVATCALYIARDHHREGDWSHLHVAFSGYSTHQLQSALAAWNTLPQARLPPSTLKVYQSIHPVSVWQT